MIKKLLFFIFSCISIFNNYAQQIWQQKTTNLSLKKYYTNQTDSKSLKLKKKYFLSIIKDAPKRNELKTSLQRISLPVDKNSFEIFEIFEASNFDTKLNQKFPSIKSYIAKSITSNKTARLSYDKYTGLHASIFSDNGTIIIQPIDKKTNEYLFYNRNTTEISSAFECNTIERAKKTFQSRKNQLSAINDGYLRKYKVAIAATGEYSNFFLTGSETTDEEKRGTVLAAINNSLTRINGIFERDFGVTMELVANNDQLIFLDANTDPFNVGNYNQETQTTLDTIIGSENYDVGHVYIHSNRIYGNAGCIACVCTEGQKGSAFTAHTDPSSDHFNMIASHEFGHQFGGYHVQSSSNCRSGINSEVEPGSGSSIMGYAGICFPNVQENPDDYFNYVDIRDIIEWTRNGSSCAELISTGNNDPTVDAGPNYTIPISTAFILKGSGDDTDNNSLLTYCWEQNDTGNPFSSNTPQPTWVQGPLFRSRLPVSSPVRYLPQLEDVINGNLRPTWEVIPSVARTMNFALTVRDNAPIGPKTTSDLMTVTVVDNGGAFAVTSQKNNETWNVGDIKTITWNVAGTNESPINATNVDILLSLDGGYTYPHTISTNALNSGEATIIVPEIPQGTTEGRIMIKPVDNIFYAINAANITIKKSEFVMNFSETDLNQKICKPNDIEYNFIYNTNLSFNEETTFSVENLPDNLTATFEPVNAINNNTPVKLTITNTTTTELEEIVFNVVGTSGTIERKSLLSFNLYGTETSVPVLSLPENNSTAIGIANVSLEWNLIENIENYTLELATDTDFNNIIETTSTTINLHTLSTNLDFNTTYYWRVKGSNLCGDSDYSEAFSFTTKCFTPTDVVATNITTSSADISWVDTNNSNDWEIEVVLTGALPLGVGTLTNNKPYLVNNLNSGTSYDVYVRSICSTSNYSEWAGPYRFNTVADYCNGDKFFDTGGENGNYSSNENITTTILPRDAEIVAINFESFDLENSFDFLTIYDGNDTNAPLIGSYTGNNSPGYIVSKKGQGITFVFTSDGSVIGSGWAATVNCITITCSEPSDLTYTNLSGGSIDLSWTANGSESQWEIEYGIKDFIKGTGNKLLTTTNPVTINTLTAETEYDFYLTAICGASPTEDDSFAVGPFTVETPCNIITAPYTFTIENQNANSTIENCWSGIPEVNQANYYWEAKYSTFFQNNTTGPYKANTGDKYFSIRDSGSNLNDEANLLSPIIDISSLSTPTLNFHSFLYGEDIVSFHVDIFNNGTWHEDVFVLNGQQQESTTDLWQENFIDLSAYNNQIQIRFRGISNGNSNNEIAIDDINVYNLPSCIKPSNFEYTNVTATTVDLSWTPNGSETSWIVEYGTPNFTPGNGTSVTVTANNYTLGNLPSDSEIEIYVKSDCGNNPGEITSDVIGPLKIETPCNIYTAPYTFTIEDQNTNSIIENCWSGNPEVNQANYYWEAKTSNFYEGNTTGPYKANAGNKYFSTQDTGSNLNDEANLLSPIIDISSLTTPTLNFHSFLYGEDIVSFHVDIFNNGMWNEDVFVLNGQQQESTTELWQQHFIDLSAYTNQIQIRFRGISNGNNNNHIAIDDINVYNLPSCIKPSNFEYTNVTATTVDLSWTPNGSETSWIVEYGASNFTPGTGTSVTVTTNNYTLENLPANSEIEIYIKSDCGNNPGEITSDVIGPLKIETPCNIYTAPYTFDVESQNTNSIIENCWSGNPEIYQANYYWEAKRSRFNQNETTGPYKANTGDHYFSTSNNVSSVGAEASLLSPIIDISSLTTPTLNFHSFMYGENISSFHVDIFNNGTWNEDVFVLNGQQQESNRDLWEEHFIDLSTYTNQIQIRFRGISNGNNNNEIAIDDINVHNLPNCIKPSNLEYTNVTATTTDLSWTANGSDTSWIVEYGTPNFNPGTGTSVIVTSNNYTLENLPSNSDIEIYIKSDCGNNPGEITSDVVGPLRIKTLCEAFTAPWYYNVEDQNTRSTIGNCWSNASSPTQDIYLWATERSTFFESNTGPYSANSGSKYFRTISNGTSAGDEASLISPTINMDNLSNPILNFYAFMYGNNVGSLHIDIFNNGNWTNDIKVINGQQQTSSRDLWNEYYVDLNIFSGNVILRFRAVSTGPGTHEIDIDDISIIEKPTCVKPTDITFSTITESSIDIHWTANDSETLQHTIEYGPQGFFLGTGTQSTTSTNTYSATDLTSNSAYDFYIRTECPNGNNSEWSGPFTRTTLPDYCNGDHFYDTGGPLGSYSNREDYTTTIYPKNANSTVTVEFNSFELESCCDFLSVYDGTDINAPLIGSYNGNSNPGIITSSHSSGALTFKFTSDGSATFSGWDATVICNSNTCPNPTDLIVEETFTDSASINWNAGNTETNWIIEYGETGFTPGSGTEIETTDRPFLLNNLNSQTEYDVYIKASCDNEVSLYSTKTTFSTKPNYCNGDRFYDSGGIINNYSNNENYTETITPSNDADRVSVTFNSFDLESCCDFLSIYDGSDINAPLIGTYSGTDTPGTITASNEDGSLTFAFTSNDFGTSSGWNAIVNCLYDCATPSNPVVENITTNEAILSWDSEDSQQTWEILLAVNDNILDFYTVNTNSYVFTNLEPGTTYQYGIRANCNENGNQGKSEWIGSFSFTTEEITCPIPSNISVQDISKNEVTLKWDAGGSEQTWQIEYGADGFTQSNGVLHSVNTNNPILTNLEPSTIYQYYIRANCGNNTDIDNSEWIGPFSFTTSDITCPVPSNTSVQDISKNEVTLKWDAGGSEQAWQIEYGTDGFSKNNGTVNNVNTNNYTLTNLEPSTVYQYYIRANCGSNNEDNSDWIGPFSFTTADITCPVPSNALTENITINKATLKWDAGGSEQTWQIEFGIDGFVRNNGNIIKVNTTNYTLKDLDASTTYQYYIRANCGSNTIDNSEWIGPFSFTTEDIICPVPSNLSISNVSKNGATLNWDVNENEQSWEIEYGIDGFSQNNGTKTDVNTNNYVFTNLEASTVYQYYIRTNCGETIDASDWIGPFSFQTLCDAISAPFHEKFTSSVIPECWGLNETNNWNFNTDAIYNSNPIDDHSNNGNSNYAWISNSTLNDSNSLKTGFINISNLNSPTLQFALFSQNSVNNEYNTVTVKLHDSSGKSITLMELQGKTEDGWETFDFNINNYTTNDNDIQVEFIVTKNNASISSDNNILIDDIKVDEEASLSTENIDIIKGFSFYPNPVKNTLIIKSNEIITKLEIYNLVGQKLIIKKLKDEKQINNLDVSELSSGSYLIKAYANKKVKTFRIIKN